MSRARVVAASFIALTLGAGIAAAGSGASGVVLGRADVARASSVAEARRGVVQTGVFTLARGVVPDYGEGPAVVGEDGTLWLAQPEPRGYLIISRATTGRISHPATIVNAGGSSIAPPAIAASGGTATFVWESASGALGSTGTVTVGSRRCTPTICAPAQTLASWGWSYANNSFPAMGYQARTAAAAASGRVIAVFLRNRANNRQMVWTQDGTSGRFGPLHVLEQDAQQSEPIALGESDGRMLTAWLDTTAQGAAPGLGPGNWSLAWAQWSASSGFTRVRTGTRVSGDYAADLVGAYRDGAGELAWISGDNETDPGLGAEPVWVARVNEHGPSTPVRVYTRDAFGLSPAAGGGSVALAFTSGLSSVAAGPAMIETNRGSTGFSAPIDLDPTASSYPTVAMDSKDGLLAAYDDDGVAKLAVGVTADGSATQLTLGREPQALSPQVLSNGTTSLVIWVTPTGEVQGTTVGP